MKVETIIFDLGGVLVDWNPLYLYNKVFDTQKEADQFIANVCDLHWNEQQDGGRTIAEGTALLIQKHPTWESHIRMYYDRWEEMLRGPIQGTVEILTALYNKKNHRLLALTNWSAETFPTALKNYAFLSYFEGILVSGEEKLKKPDARIYQLILDRYSVDPTTSIFIDDNLRNVEAAIRCGIQSIHFKSPEQLRIELRDKYDIADVL